MKDSLGDRMKEFYENRTRIFLPRRTYTIIRVDGKAFHTYTRGLDRPFDMKLVEDMDETACYMCKNIQGAKLAFVQSDEISIVLTDFDNLNTDAWYDGNIQKITSISASLATAKFNELRQMRYIKNRFDDGVTNVTYRWMELLEGLKTALFDSRTFTIPTKTEVINYLIWRQQDTVRNSISSVAQYHFSPKELHGKSTNEMQDMIHERGMNWNDFQPKLKRGRLILKEAYDKDGASRTRWVSTECPTFTQDINIHTIIPDN